MRWVAFLDAVAVAVAIVFAVAAFVVAVAHSPIVEATTPPIGTAPKLPWYFCETVMAMISSSAADIPVLAVAV